MADVTVSEQKSLARKRLIKNRLALTAEQLSTSSAALCRELIGLREFIDADTVLLFYPTKNEPDLLDVAREALVLGKDVAFPISIKDTCALEFRCIEELSNLSAGAYGICEPSLDARAPAITERTLCVLPALAFDKKGFRLGYGKGYYDRFLSDFRGITAGAAMNGYLCEALPADTHDIPADIVITETGVIRTKCH